jgi:ribosomal-protein-alanine N-acetyltransferase
VRRSDETILGAITLDHIRRGPAQAGTTGYWIGEAHARQGYMREAIEAVVHYAFTPLDLRRIEAGCLPENTPSRGLRVSCGYKYEGVAPSYLPIDGRWRNHGFYANRRHDRRGKTDVG